ncbi:hypothetical protein K5X82_18200 [Halosquirtibacter xylanolyticus]|uniref:hypothetical protein n=1 Tax=Halosquirtibacter xylanolyticus TaxID=3374599 RepID=UPI003747F80F|nr:hypothetical protein K5X82_18200 [Prolixibacteraceae bacterium]
MKKLTSSFVLCLILIGYTARAQDNGLSVSGTFMNRYIWRGNDYGNSPVVQPAITFKYGWFQLGAWGSYALTNQVSATEADLWTSINITTNTTLILTDYYFPTEPGTEGSYFSKSSHTFEIGLIQSIKNFTLSAYYETNGNRTFYGEAKYTWKNTDFFVGTSGAKFDKLGELVVTNIGIVHTKKVKISDHFDMPIMGAIILNPHTEQIYLTFGFSIK